MRNSALKGQQDVRDDMQQNSEYQWDQRTDGLNIRSQVIVEGIIGTFLKIDLYHEVCVEYLRTKVNVWFSALRSIEELSFNDNWIEYIETTEEKLQRLREHELKSNELAFEKVCNELLENAYRRTMDTRFLGFDALIKEDDKKIIENMKLPWRPKEALEKCLSECENFIMLFNETVIYLQNTITVFFADAPIIRWRLIQIISILEQEKANFIAEKKRKEA